MEWTAEHIDTMRVGRPSYGDSHKSGALTWRRTGQETGGEYGLLYLEAGPGYTLGAHYHTAYAETYKVLEGHFPGRVGDHKVHLRAGDEVVVPAGTIQSWGPITDTTARVVVEVRPAHEGFEKWGLIAHNMAADSLTGPDMTPNSFVHLAVMIVGTDSCLPGLARVLNPIFKVVAWFAHKAGVDRRLEEKYFHPARSESAAA